MEPAVVQILDVALDPGVEGGRVSLAVEIEGGRCTFAEGTATDGGVQVGLLDAALADWIDARVGPVRAALPGLDPCEGLPPVDALAVPATGWAIGLRHPSADPIHTGPFDLHPIGEDGRWWHVHPTDPDGGAGAIVFRHDDDPPTRFSIRVDPALVAPATRTAEVPRGGAVILELERMPTYFEALPEGIVALHRSGERLVALGLASGAAEVLLRSEGTSPEPLRIEVGAALGPARDELVIPLGSRRRMLSDAEVRDVWVARPELLDVRFQGTKITLRGLAPGRTAVVIDAGASPVLVPVAVGG